MNWNLILLAAVLTLGLTTAAEVHWSYPNPDTDEGFPVWGGVCESGTRQSPINLNIKGCLRGVYAKLDLDNYDDAQHGVAMVNNGHTIQLSGFTNKMELEGGPLLDDYVVEQIHLHWWSEHTIDGIRYPLEAHIVHRNKRYPNVTDATKHSDGLTVIGILYHVSNQHNDAIQEVIDNLDEVKGFKNLNKPIRMKKPFTVRHLFPKINGYMTYGGSLTTPSCAESVTWIVLHETFPVTLEQIEKFKEVEYDEGKRLTNNYRNIQPMNNRPVVVVLPETFEDNDDGASALHVSMGAILMTVIFAKFLQ